MKIQQPPSTSVDVSSALLQSPPGDDAPAGHLLDELGRLIQENKESKRLNQRLQEEIDHLKSTTTPAAPENVSSDDTLSYSDQGNNNEKDDAVALLKAKLVEFQGQNQASEEFIASLKYQNKGLNEKIVQLTAQTVMLGSSNSEQNQELDLLRAENVLLKKQIAELLTTSTKKEEDAPSAAADDLAVHDSETIEEGHLPSESTANVSPQYEVSTDCVVSSEVTPTELQDTIQVLQKRIMDLIEEKLQLQTHVENLEHLMVEEKVALKATIESMNLPTPVEQKKFFSSSKPKKQQQPSSSKPQKQQQPSSSKPKKQQPSEIIINENTNQGDILRQTIERKRRSTVFGSKSYKEKKIDVEFYWQASTEKILKEKQKLLAKEKKKQLAEQKRKKQEEAAADDGKSINSSSSNNSYIERLVQHRLWDYQDWSVDEEEDEDYKSFEKQESL